MLLTAPAVVYRLPLDGSSQPVRLAKLRAAMGRPAAIALQPGADGTDHVWVLSQESEQLALIDPREDDPGVRRVIKAASEIRQLRWLRNGPSRRQRLLCHRHLRSCGSPTTRWRWFSRSAEPLSDVP